MVIKRKVSRDQNQNIKPLRIVDEKAIQEIIERGGKTKEDNQRPVNVEEIRFTLRIDKRLMSQIDKYRAKRSGSISRNQWIVETLAEKLESK